MTDDVLGDLEPSEVRVRFPPSPTGLLTVFFAWIRMISGPQRLHWIFGPRAVTVVVLAFGFVAVCE